MSFDTKDAQINLLADRLALAYSFIQDVEIDIDYERHADEPNRFSRARFMVLSELEQFEKMRAKRRQSVFYECAKREIREWIKVALAKERNKQRPEQENRTGSTTAAVTAG